MESASEMLPVAADFAWVPIAGLGGQPVGAAEYLAELSAPGSLEDARRYWLSRPGGDSTQVSGGLRLRRAAVELQYMGIKLAKFGGLRVMQLRGPSPA